MVSVIIPVYKVEKYLDRCVESVCNQTYKDIEIILVDDGGIDKCPQKCDEWRKKDQRIKVIHQKNMGLSEARNRGLESSCGEYVIYVDSDDYIENDMIEILMTLIVKYDADIAISTYRLSQNEDFKSFRLSGNVMVENAERANKIIFENGLWQAWAKLIKRDIALKCKFLKDLIYEDYENTPRLLLMSEKVVFSMDGRYVYTVRDDGIMGKRKKITNDDFVAITSQSIELYEASNYSESCKQYMYAFLFKQLIYNYNNMLKGTNNSNNSFALKTKKLLKEKKYIWIKCDLISKKRRVAYFLILGMSFFYDCIYRITHK